MQKQPEERRTGVAHLSRPEEGVSTIAINPGSIGSGSLFGMGQVRNFTGYLYLFPFIEQGPIYNQINFNFATGAADWNLLSGGGNQAILDNLKLPIFLCPSERPNNPFSYVDNNPDMMVRS